MDLASACGGGDSQGGAATRNQSRYDLQGVPPELLPVNISFPSRLNRRPPSHVSDVSIFLVTMEANRMFSAVRELCNVTSMNALRSA
jgi:hypothetical protein